MIRKIIANEWVGLHTGGAGTGLRRRGCKRGLAYGGWHTSYFGELSQQRAAANISAAGACLFGHPTCQSFAAHRPQASEAERPLAEPLNTRPKYVASATLTEPLTWVNSYRGPDAWALWASGTISRGAVTAMQAGGNLVVRSRARKVLWGRTPPGIRARRWMCKMTGVW